MSVIGRLDDQVDRVLIAPLNKNRQRETDDREPALDEHSASSRPARQIRQENEGSQDEQPAPEELPVWLL
ncbi:MAG TPA: hypothetical protein VF528_07460 [Pyrinomonadaceae bacterium]|jgi:hypothetical protein